MPEQQEQIVTPFAQILHTLHNVHKNYMLLTNVSSNRYNYIYNRHNRFLHNDRVMLSVLPSVHVSVRVLKVCEHDILQTVAYAGFYNGEG